LEEREQEGGFERKALCAKRRREKEREFVPGDGELKV